MSDTEADTCRKFVLPKLYAAGWTDDQISEQRTITAGRLMLVEGAATPPRKKGKRADYLLYYRLGYPIAVVEAKASYKKPGDGLQQAKEYAEMLGLKFAFSTNGKSIIEHDYLTGQEREIDAFPTADQLWTRVQKAQGLEGQVGEKLLTPPYHIPGKVPRYYQEIAINSAVQAVLKGKSRILLTMATGTGKTFVAFQIIWKLWSARWNRSGDSSRKPRVLYLSDRNILIDKPKDIEFAPFGDARHKISREAVKSREIYFAIYQSLAKDESRSGLYREYPRDFFDLIVVDECHRGSARDESNWREILEYFEPAFQLGMTATPLREDNRDTYHYFGNPIYTYSLKQGIEDGFLAPYRVHRVVSSVDAAGWRPTPGERDRYGREVPDALYNTPDFDTFIVLTRRTEAIAKHLTQYLKRTDRFAKTIVFCADQEHATAMRMALNNENLDLTKEHPDYVARVVADEGEVGRGHLYNFTDIEKATPAIVTTSKLLTTGVDAPTCKNIVIARTVNSMTEFKQIIGRGTRLKEEYGKYFFTILDYTGSATRHFADPDFDGDPAEVVEQEMDGQGLYQKIVCTLTPEKVSPDALLGYLGAQIVDPPKDAGRRKFYVDGAPVEIVADVVYLHDSDGKQLRVVKYTDYAAESVRSIYPSAAELRSKWTFDEEREHIITALRERGISLDELLRASGQEGADPFDLLCHAAFSLPVRSRRERAELLRKNRPDFFKRYGEEARQVLNEVLDKYVEHGVSEFKVPDILQVPPISKHGNVMEISNLFGGAEQLRSAVSGLQSLLYTQ